MNKKINFIRDKEKISSEFAKIGEELIERVDGTAYFTGKEDQQFDSLGFIRIKSKQFRLIVDYSDKMYLCSRENKNCCGYINCNEVVYVIENNKEAYKVKKNGGLEGEDRNIEWSEVDYRKILINLMNKSFELQNMDIRI